MNKDDRRKIRDLRRTIGRARKSSDFVTASDLTIHVAQRLRKAGLKNESIDEFKEVLEMSADARVKLDKILAIRSLAEMYAEKGDERCHKYLRRFERLVEDDNEEHQLMKTSAAYCMIKLYAIDTRDKKILLLAREYAEEALELLETQIMNPMKMRGEGDSIDIRKINCYRILSEIEAYENRKAEAEEHSKIAMELAKGITDFQFAILMTRIDFPWRSRLTESMELCRFADSFKMRRSKKIEAKLFIVEALFESGDVEKGLDVLFLINPSHMNDFSVANDDRQKYRGALIFAYKATEREKRLQKCEREKDRQGKYYQTDALGDLFLREDYKKIALNYYKTALESANQRHRINALISCAETSAELDKFEEAKEYFDQVKSEEIQQGDDTSEMYASIFEMKVRGELFHSDADMLKAVERLEKRDNAFLDSVYDGASCYFDKKGMKKEAKRFRKKERHFKDNNKRRKQRDRDEKDRRLVRRIPDDLDKMSKARILEIMRRRALEFVKNNSLTGQGRLPHYYADSDEETSDGEVEEEAREAERRQRKRGARDDTEDANLSVGSRRKQRENAMRIAEDDTIIVSDDDSVLNHNQLQSTNLQTAIKRARISVIVLSSESEEEEDEEEMAGVAREMEKDDNTVDNRGSILEFDDTSTFGVYEGREEEEERPPLAELRNGLRNHSILPKSQGKKRSMEGGNENENTFNADDTEMSDGVDRKRRREDSDSSDVESRAESTVDLGEKQSDDGVARVKRTLEEEFQIRCDPSDRESLLSDALRILETSSFPSFIIDEGDKYAERTVDALWQVIEEFVEEKRREDGEWRVETIHVEHFDIPASGLRTLIRMRPRDTLSLRVCGVTNEKLEEMTEELTDTDISTLETLDLSSNQLITSSGSLANFVSKLTGLKRVILQGLLGIEDGLDLMKTLRVLSLNWLALDDNLWLDDISLEELIDTEEAMGKLTQLEISGTSIRSLSWLAGIDSFASLRELNISENRGIMTTGWKRLAGFIRTSRALKKLKLNGTGAGSMILEALADRSLNARHLTVDLRGCDGVTSNEVVRVLTPLVRYEEQVPNLRVQMEREKVDEVHAAAPDLASKILRATA